MHIYRYRYLNLWFSRLPFYDVVVLGIKWRYFVHLNLRVMCAVICVFLIKSFPVCLYNSCMSVALFICVSIHKLCVHIISSIVFDSLMNL